MFDKKRVCAVAALIVGTFGLQAARAELKPSEAVTLMVHAMQYQPDANRTALTGPIIERMATDDLSETELFFKGEAHFLNFEPEPARDAYWELRHRTDDIGRVAAQRLMIIRVNAFGMIDEVLDKDVPRYRERFGIRPYDRFGVTYPLARAARQLAERGEADRALDVVADEVRRHAKFDAPYDAYELPVQFMELAVANGRGEEFRSLLGWVVEGLDAAVERPVDARAAPANRIAALPGASVFSLFGERLYDEYLWAAKLRSVRAKLRTAAENGAVAYETGGR